MNFSEISRLLSKQPIAIPYAEDWLNCPNVPNKELWSFWGGFFNLEVYEDERKNLARRLLGVKKSLLTTEAKHNIMVQMCEEYLKDFNDGNSSDSKNTSFGYY
jgi:hypothetical protein